MTSLRYVPYVPYVACVALDGNPALIVKDHNPTWVFVSILASIGIGTAVLHKVMSICTKVTVK